MFEWLTSTPIPQEQLSTLDSGGRVVVGLFMGGAVAMILRFSPGPANSEDRSLYATLVLLCALIAMVTMVIGGSVAKAFSLVGALSIVRFRTVVEDTRDTAFVIFSVIVGMAVGSGFFALPAIGIATIGGTAIALQNSFKGWGTRDQTFELTIRLPLSCNPDEVLRNSFFSYFERSHLQAASTVKQGTLVEYIYQVHVHSRDSLPEIARQIAQLDGINGFEIKSKT